MERKLIIKEKGNDVRLESSARKVDKITHHFAKDEKEFYLKGLLSVRQYMKNQTFDLLVQDEISKTLKPYKMVWMSDTQYYARSYPHIFKKWSSGSEIKGTH